MPGVEQRLDMETIDELRQIMGDEFQTLIDTFNTDSQLRLQNINSAVASGDAEKIRRAAHSFKGSAGNMGAVALRDLCRVMEEHGQSGHVSGCEQLAEQIAAEYHAVQQALSTL